MNRPSVTTLLIGLVALSALFAAAGEPASAAEKPAPVTTCPDQPARGDTPASDAPAAPDTIFNPKATRFSDPIYPACAEQKDVSGTVDIEFTIEPDGSPANPRVLREAPEGYGFAASALKALSTWQFEPKRVDGKPVVATARSRIGFKIPEPENYDALEVAPSPLTRVAPLYPEKAERLHKSGSVDFVFTLKADGSVGDIGMVQEEPAGYGFGLAAANALSLWKFPPNLEDGKPVPKRVKYRISFKIL